MTIERRRLQHRREAAVVCRWALDQDASSCGLSRCSTHRAHWGVAGATPRTNRCIAWRGGARATPQRSWPGAAKAAMPGLAQIAPRRHIAQNAEDLDAELNPAHAAAAFDAPTHCPRRRRSSPEPIAFIFLPPKRMPSTCGWLATHSHTEYPGVWLQPRPEHESHSHFQRIVVVLVPSKRLAHVRSCVCVGLWLPRHARVSGALCVGLAPLRGFQCKSLAVDQQHTARGRRLSSDALAPSYGARLAPVRPPGGWKRGDD